MDSHGFASTFEKLLHSSRQDADDPFITLAQIRAETADAMSDEKRLGKLLAEHEEKVERFELLAEKAVRAGSEDDARAFLYERRRLLSDQALFEDAYRAAAEYARYMREMHDQLASDINERFGAGQNDPMREAVEHDLEELRCRVRQHTTPNASS